MNLENINKEIDKYKVEGTINKKTEKNIMQKIANIKPSEVRQYEKIVKCYHELFEVMLSKRNNAKTEADKNKKKFKSCFLDTYKQNDTLTNILNYKTGFGSSLGSMKGTIKKQMNCYKDAYISTLERLKEMISILKNSIDLNNERLWLLESLMLLKWNDSYWIIDKEMTVDKMIQDKKNVVDKLKKIIPQNMEDIKNKFKQNTEDALIKYTK